MPQLVKLTYYLFTLHHAQLPGCNFDDDYTEQSPSGQKKLTSMKKKKKMVVMLSLYMRMGTAIARTTIASQQLLC